MADNVGFNIPKELLNPIIRDTVNAYIVSALGDPAEIIKKVVNDALMTKVASNGKRSSYEYENKHSYIQVISENVIREIAKECVDELLKENREKIKEEIKRSVNASGNLGEFICKGFFESLDCKWTTRIDVRLGNDEN